MTTTAPTSPNSWPDLGEDEVVEGVGDRDHALAQAPAGDAAGPERQQALDGVEARPERVGPGVEPGPDPLHLVAAQPDEDRRHERATAQQAPRCSRFAPATKNIMKRRQGDDRGRAEVRLPEHEDADRREDDQEWHRAAPEPVDLRAALGEPVGEIDDERELGDLRGVDGRQPGQLEPAGRAADDDVELRPRNQHQEQDERAPRNGTDARRR